MSQEVNHKYLPKEQHDKAVRFLRIYFSKQAKAETRNAMEEDPEKWWAILHFNWGMEVRNALRANGCSEQDLGIGNLDDYYIPLVEEAVQ